MEYINSQINISEDSDILTQFTILLSMTNSLSYLNEVTNNTKEYLNNNLNVMSFANGDDFIVSSGKMNFIITTTKNQKKRINDNITIIDLGKCEMKLKDEYNISKNESLFIVMIDILVENIQKLEYEVYYNFSSNNITKLNLTLCKDIRIDISIPKDIPINEIDKYNKSSGFYNDICYTFTSIRGTDEILKDRRNDYKNNNISICEEDCDFTEYNTNTKKAICSCFVKVTLPLISEIKVDRNKIFSNFKDIKSIGNFQILSCIKLFLNDHNIFKNSSYYMLIILLLLSVISILIFSFYDYKKIKKFIADIEKKNSKKKEIENIMETNNDKNEIKNLDKNSMSSDNRLKNTKIKVKIKVKKKIKIKKKILIDIKHNDNSDQSFVLLKKNNNKKKLTFEEKIEALNDFEFGELSYEEALIKDKRTYIQSYISLIKTKHLLFFSFFQLNDYNSHMIKIFIFFFTFALNLIVSAMFYSDSTMHKIHADYGEFDFAYQLPQMIYSFIISTILINLLNNLGIYEKDIAEFKKNKVNKEKLLSKIKIKIIIFFIIVYILLFSFWIYLGCFCVVYKNTQIHLLLDVLSSFSISMITPFFGALLPCLFRILSLKDKNRKRIVLFKLSNFLQNF